ncbi:aminotransferase class V-fold PLP-dependent enzyme [uncultured Campylobacter sp.]|uniref:aminotransferase class V-fold PLP-dependent enzyme n=1 Tax=uncultured Campylobacter sp. TaxID=218934 RepID=UPI00260BF773|nr:aminotransferase class V-fold PLP-dependent enzyme [uncultured Campylobacter sp.]
MDIKDLKKDIILKKKHKYFDFTASALALRSVEKEIRKILLTYANTHSDSALNSFITQKYYDDSRAYIKKSLALSDDFALIACGTGASAAIKKFQELLGLYVPPLVKKKYFSNIDKKDLPLVIIGPFEHHSNEISFREALCECIRVPLNKNLEVDYEFFEKTLQENSQRKIIISFSLASNVTGVFSDYKKIYSLAKKYKAILAFDGASFIAYKNINCDFYDALFISSHKILGGVGACGLLAIKKSLCGDIPSFAAGGTVSYVSKSSANYLNDVEILEEGGTPGILQLIRASLAFKKRDEIGLDYIEKKSKILKEYFLKKLEQIEDVVLYAGNFKDRLCIFSFNINGISPFDLSYTLSKYYKIETRAGCACAGPYGHDLLGLKDNQKLENKPGWLRVSLHYTHDIEDLDYFFDSLKKSIDRLKY